VSTKLIDLLSQVSNSDEAGLYVRVNTLIVIIITNRNKRGGITVAQHSGDGKKNGNYRARRIARRSDRTDRRGRSAIRGVNVATALAQWW